jgi:hypothetical protein
VANTDRKAQLDRDLKKDGGFKRPFQHRYEDRIVEHSEERGSRLDLQE